MCVLFVLQVCVVSHLRLEAASHISVFLKDLRVKCDRISESGWTLLKMLSTFENGGLENLIRCKGDHCSE